MRFQWQVSIIEGCLQFRGLDQRDVRSSGVWIRGVSAIQGSGLEWSHYTWYSKFVSIVPITYNAMFVCGHIHTCIHTYIYIHTCIHTVNTYIHTVYPYIHAYMHTYVRTYIYIYVYIHTYCTYIHTCIHAYISTYLHVYVLISAHFMLSSLGQTVQQVSMMY